MNTPDLQRLAIDSRSRREAGVTLLLASFILGLFLVVPRMFETTPSPSPIVIATSTVQSAFSTVSIEARAAVVYDLATGEILYSKNADAQLPLASLTKLLTVYAALSELSPTTPITVPRSAAAVEYPRALPVGSVFALDDLARVTLTGSLNDGAVAIAEATADRESRSQREMLAGAAAALELSQTYALNGSGLDVSKMLSGAYGSAKDLARLAGALVEKAPAIARATTARAAEAISLSGLAVAVKNTDPFIDGIPHLLLSKTGFTDLAGGNLALVFDAAIRHPVAIVVLGSTVKERFTDATALVAATFAHFAGVPSL